MRPRREDLRLRVWLPSLLAVALALAPSACRNVRATKEQAQAAAPSASAPALPAIEVRDESTALTFSWITLDGGFQLAKSVSEVPYEARDAVRVWSETSGDGVSGPWIYVADLRTKRADGTYKVEVVARTFFEGLALARRDKAKVAKADPKPGAGQGGIEQEPPVAKGDKKAAPTVIIYGADWCKPCHMAENWLKAKGIPYEHKDIDDPNVNEEMRDKLMAAGIKSHSIPVLDVAGKILVGFSESELEKALAAAGAPLGG